MKFEFNTVLSAFAQGYNAISGSFISSAGTVTEGAVRVLHYNNLGPQNNGTTALLIQDALTHADAGSACGALGEKVYPWSSAAVRNQTELQYELDYLVHTDELDADDLIWVSTSLSNSSSECKALSALRKKLVQVPCNVTLSTLCTSSPPPTTDVDRTVLPSSKITVKSNEYTITGYRDARSFRFLGIPFADPPVGNLRLAPPQAYSGPRVIDATTLSDSCIQTSSSFGVGPDDPISEDCLYLNVFTPVVPGTEHESPSLRPVAVYLYGGSFLTGTASVIDFDGGNFASRSDVVIVTLNYRLGALGFLSTGNLTTGSYGIRDQIMALEWVQKHIQSFGGDQSQVTVFGQSAGGQSVTALLSSTAAKGLMSAAVIQSAPLDLPWATRPFYAKYVAPAVGQAVGCTDSESEASLLECLRSVPAEHFLQNSTEFKDALAIISTNLAGKYFHETVQLSETEPFLPVVDETGSGVIDDQFHTLIANDSLPIKVPTMFTNVHDEADLFLECNNVPLGNSQVTMDAIYGKVYGQKLGGDIVASGAFMVNASDPNGVCSSATNTLTYTQYTCAQGYLLNRTGHSFPSLYQFEIEGGHVQTNKDVPAICSPNNRYNATCHTADILPIWGTLNSKTQDVDPYYDDDDIRQSQLLHDVFSSFFRTHTPNPDLDLLKVRGPAFASTHNILTRKRNSLQSRADPEGFKIEQYHPSDQELNNMGWPPSQVQNFAHSAKCAVFRNHGFTFQRAVLVD